MQKTSRRQKQERHKATAENRAHLLDKTSSAQTTFKININVVTERQSLESNQKPGLSYGLNIRKSKCALHLCIYLNIGQKQMDGQSDTKTNGKKWAWGCSSVARVPAQHVLKALEINPLYCVEPHIRVHICNSGTRRWTLEDQRIKVILSLKQPGIHEETSEQRNL